MYYTYIQLYTKMPRDANYIYRREKSYSKYFNKLYKDTYWGYGVYHKDKVEECELILCQNRDKLAERYALKSPIKLLPKKYRNQVEILTDEIYLQQLAEKNHIVPILADSWYRDHSEYYRTEEGNIVSVFSTYDKSDEVIQLNLRNEYILIEPIYNFQANTFIKLIYKE